MEITDRTLTVTGVITLLVVLGCVGVVLTTVGGLGGLSGFSVLNTTYGHVNISVSTTVDIGLEVNNVDFGTGYVNPTGNTLVNSTNIPAKTTNPNGFSSPLSFWLRNEGNVYVNLTVNGSTANDLFSGASASYQYRLENTSLTESRNTTCFDYAGPTACTNINCFTAYAGILQDFTNADKSVCPNMSYHNVSGVGGMTDEFNVSIIFVLNTLTNGSVSDTIWFTARSLGA